MNTTIYNKTEVLVRRQPFMGNRLDVMILVRDNTSGIEKLSVAQPLTLVPVTEEWCEPKPTCTLQPQAAQQLMDELWQCGLRPTEGTGSAGALAATERHLADMQKLVFGHQVKPNTNQSR